MRVRLYRKHRPIWGRLIIAAVLVAFALLANQQPAQAHGYILRSIPQDQSVVARSPSRIQIWFSENLEARFSTLSLSNEKGDPMPLQDSGVVPGSPAQLAARITAPLPDGLYIMTMRIAFASDGHVTTERMIFWVGQKGSAITAVSSSAGQDTVPLEVVWRVLTLIPLNVLFGTFMLYSVVLLPGWGNQRYRAGGLAPRVMARLNLLIWVMIILAMAGCVLALFQQTMSLFAADLSTVLRNGPWSVALIGTQFGDVLSVRLGLLVIMAAIQIASLYLSTRYPAGVMPVWGNNIAVAALLLGTMSASSHTAGSTLWPIESIVVDWLHLLANSAWIGGLVALSAALPAALAPLGAFDRQAALLAVLRRFSIIGVVAVALLAATGIYSALLFVRQPSDLTGTNYGRTLVSKVLLVAPLLLFGLYHHLSVTRGRLAPLAQRLRLSKRVMTLATSVRAEAVLGSGVILIAALLTATPPPTPPDARGKIEAPSQSVTVAGTQIKLSLDPGATGPNTYEITLLRDGQPVTGAQVSLRFAYPTLDKRSSPIDLDDTDNGSYFGAGLDLERSGDWQALVDVVPAGGDRLRAAFRWNVLSAAPTPDARQPSLLNWLSGGAILAVLGAWLWPGRDRLHALKLQLESVAIALVATAITIALLVLGTGLLNDAAQRTDNLRNPTPVVVNPVVADMQSVTAGQQVYEAQCVGCHGPTGAGSAQIATPIPDVRLRLSNRRDEELYKVIPHPGQAPLSERERWDVINYLRSSVFVPPAPPSGGQTNAR